MGDNGLKKKTIIKFLIAAVIFSAAFFVGNISEYSKKVNQIYIELFWDKC